MPGHEPANRSHCQNCDSPLTGPFCSKCGQHDVDYHRSIGPVIEDALEGFLHFDGKFFKSMRYIFSRPGFLTNEFIAGRRTRYAHPVRFYIFASFLYFAAHALISPTPTPREAAATAAEAKRGAEEADKEAKEAASDAPNSTVGNVPAKDSGFSLTLQKDFGLDGKLDQNAVLREFGHLIPTMLFLCLPLLAAVLKLFYRKSGRYYIEHLIFALHVQAFVFLAALADNIVEALARLAGARDSSLVGFLTFCGGTWLVYRSLRVVYGQGKLKTLLKMMLVGGSYGMIILFGIVLVALTSAFVVAHGA